MRTRPVILRLAAGIVVAFATLAIGSSVSFARDMHEVPKENLGSTDHTVGDALAQGVDFVLAPLHRGLSRVCFIISPPPDDQRVTTITLFGPPQFPEPPQQAKRP